MEPPSNPHYGAVADNALEMKEQLIEVPVNTYHSNRRRIEQEDCMIAFSELWYWVGPKNTNSRRARGKVKNILRGLNGYIPVGSLTAVIGQSGSGKTTFLEVLSGVPTSGHVRGNITRFVDGKEIEFALINQIPTLSANETVEEVIRFGCNVFNDNGKSKEQIDQKVDKIMRDFNLQKVQKSLVSTLSGGEKKRVSIARHCAGDPKVMVLDEPTSGLDTFNAFNMMQILKNLCLNEQCTIIVSIHQPQKRIVDLFDYLISFKDGRMVFQGEVNGAIASRSQLLQQIKIGPASTLDADDREFVKEQVAKSMDPLTNAAEYLLETEYLFTPKELSDWNDTFVEHDTPMFTQDIRRQSTKEYKSVNSKKRAKYLWTKKDMAQGMRAFSGLVGREMREYRRHWSKIPVIVVIHVLSALFLGITYGEMSDGVLDVQNRIGGLSFIGLFVGILSISFIGTLYEGRAVYIEERNSKMYGAVPYLVARVLPSVFFMRIIPTIVAALIIYSTMGLQDDHMTEFVVVATLLSAVTTFNVVAISSISSTIYGAATTGILFNMLMLLFGGMFLQNGLDLHWSIVWVKYLSFYEQALEILCVNEFTGLKFSVGDMEEPEDGLLTINGQAMDMPPPEAGLDVKMDGEFFLDVFGMDAAGKAEDYALLFGLSAVYLLISLYALQFLHRTTR